MGIADAKPLVLAWWNTSLSPLRKPRDTGDDKTRIICCVQELLRSFTVDVLALGEVCTQDVLDILDAVANPHISYHDATHMNGKGQSDVAVLFDRRRLALDGSRALLDSYGRTTLKIGEQLNLVLGETGQYIYLFVSHWPSRLYCSESSARRTEIGTSLRKTLDEIRCAATTPPFIVLMGDYNDDPFSPSLAHHLLATRDRQLARENGLYLYNPFWRMLGESDPFAPGQTKTGICGTYYYRGGKDTRWYTFDQIMFSSAFLGDGPLILNEEYCQIIRNNELETQLHRSTSILDHLPVLSVVEIRRHT